MRRRRVLLILLLTTPLCGGCGRGCSEPRQSDGPRPKVTSSPTDDSLRLPIAPTVTSAPRSPADAIELALGLTLPRRMQDDTLPSLATYPHRVLHDWTADRHLVASLHGDSLLLLGERLPFESLRDEARLRTVMRSAAERWGTRSGTAATRLVLAIDRQTPPEDAAALRRVAMKSHNWHVVALVREGEQLVEVMLGPAPTKRPHP